MLSGKEKLILLGVVFLGLLSLLNLKAAQTPTQTNSEAKDTASVVLLLDPAEKIVKVGDLLTVDIKIEPNNQAVDAANIDLTFDSQSLKPTALVPGIFDSYPVQEMGGNSILITAFNGPQTSQRTKTAQSVTLATISFLVTSNEKQESFLTFSQDTSLENGQVKVLKVALPAVFAIE